MTQALRGFADTALSVGVDISQEISLLYAPPASWSHGYLWGADVATIPRGAAFTPNTNRILKASHLLAASSPARRPATQWRSTHRRRSGPSTR